MAGSGNPRPLSFITEKEVEDVKRKRQEDWERVRRAEDPKGMLKIAIVSTFISLS